MEENPTDGFFKIQPEMANCEECKFSLLYKHTRDLCFQRQEYYTKIFEKIISLINGQDEMKCYTYDHLPTMIEKIVDNSGDKVKIKAELKKLENENQQLALQLMRLKGEK